MKKHDENETHNGGLKELIREFRTESKETRAAFKDAFKEMFTFSKISNTLMVVRDGAALAKYEFMQQDCTPTEGKYKFFRSLNRRRIYFFRYIGRSIRYAWTKFKYDIPERVTLDPAQVKSVLFLQHICALGDMITETGLIKSMYEAGIAVDLIVPQPVAVLLEGNPYIRNFYIVDTVSHPEYMYQPHFPLPDDVLAKLIENQYDLVIDTNTAVYPYHTLAMLDQIKPKAVVGFNRWPSVNYYVRSFDIDVNTTHISRKAVMVAEYLGIDSENADKYVIYLPPEIDQEAQAYLSGINRKILLLNIFGSHQDRCFTMPQLSALLKGIQDKYPELHIVLLDHKRVIDIALPDNVTINPFNTLHHCMALVKHTDYVITVDTSVVHMSRAWRKPLLGVYRQRLTNDALWAPGYPEAIQLITDTKPLADQPNVVEKVLEKVPELLG